MRRTIAMICAAAFAGFVSASSAQEAPAWKPTPENPARVREMIRDARGKAPAIAAYYGWKGAPPVVADGGLDSDATKVSLGEDEIFDLVKSMDADWVSDAIDLIVAHEVWHYVEVQQSGEQPATLAGDRRRLNECRADLMAARYVTSATGRPLADEVPGAVDPVFLLSYIGAPTIAGELWTNNSAEHPTGPQRRLIARYGAMSVYAERAAAEKSPLATPLSTYVDRQRGEGLDAWRDRICKGIVHYRMQALTALAIDPYEKDVVGDDVRLRVRYENIGSRTLRVAVVIQANASPADTARPGRRWTFSDTFEVKPGAEYVLTRKLNGAANDFDRVFAETSLEYEDAIISAEFKDGGFQASDRFDLGPDLSAADVEWALALQQLVNEAPSAFARYRGPGAGRFGASVVFPSLASPPGWSQTQIWLGNDGSSYLNANLYIGASATDARQTYAAFLARVRKVWPKAEVVARPMGADSMVQVTDIWISRYSKIELKLSEQGYPSVELTIRPNVLGIVGEQAGAD